jgi:hypothetical protein
MTTTTRPPCTREPGPELRLYAGLEKTCFFFKPSPVVIFLCGFFGFFFSFLVFVYIFAQMRKFLGFFSFKNTFRCIQTLNFNHSY